MKLLEWFKTLQRIVRDYDSDLGRLTRDLDYVRDLLKERTAIDICVGIKEPNTVFVSGNYGGVDYVNVFSVGHGDFTEVVKMLKHMERYGTVRRIDAPRMQASFIRDSLKNTY